MKITKSQIAIIAIIVVSFAVSFYYYPQLPEKMASHWNAQGEVDAYMGKEVGAFLMPCIIAGTFLLFMLIIQIDPLKKNIEKFKGYYYGFIIAMCLFLFGIHCWMLLWNVGVKVKYQQGHACCGRSVVCLYGAYYDEHQTQLVYGDTDAVDT